MRRGAGVSCASTNRREFMVKVQIEKGVANHLAPESCGAHREVRAEALTGVPVGNVVKPRKRLIPGVQGVAPSEDHVGATAIARRHTTRRGGKAFHAGKTHERELGDLGCSSWQMAPWAREENP